MLPKDVCLLGLIFSEWLVVSVFTTSHIIWALFKVGLFGWGPGQLDEGGGISAQSTGLEPDILY